MYVGSGFLEEERHFRKPECGIGPVSVSINKTYQSRKFFKFMVLGKDNPYSLFHGNWHPKENIELTKSQPKNRGI